MACASHPIIIKAMKKILDAVKLKWSEYLLEILVIIFGVLIAFWLEGWRQDIRDGKVQRNLLMGLAADLREDNEDITEFIDWCDGRNKSARILIDQNLTEAERLKHIANLGFTARLEIVESTFQEMSNSGAIQSIEDTDLRLMITSYYGLARDRLDVNDFLGTEILRFRAALEELGYPYRGGDDMPAEVIESGKVRALIILLGKDADIIGGHVVGLKKANEALLGRLQEMMPEKN